MTSEILCRFCLSTKNDSLNPLISPCQCKGSMEFVHLRCLNRWREIDVLRNGRICLLCLTKYTDCIEFEIIPKTDSLTYYVLSYPGLLLLYYNAVYILVLNDLENRDEFRNAKFFYSLSLYFFTFLYSILFQKSWQVKNKQLYWKQLKTIWTPCYFLFQFYSFYLLEQQTFFIGPFLPFSVGLSWHMHKRFLQNINKNLLEGRGY
jgi:hypothetical protein